MSGHDDYQTLPHLAAARAGQTPANDLPIVSARFLAAGGAHVTVTGAYLPIEADDVHYVECEACGPLDDEDLDARFIQDVADHVANRHANTCRRIPKRLWPEGGAR